MVAVALQLSTSEGGLSGAGCQMPRVAWSASAMTMPAPMPMPSEASQHGGTSETCRPLARGSDPRHEMRTRRGPCPDQRQGGEQQQRVEAPSAGPARRPPAAGQDRARRCPGRAERDQRQSRPAGPERPGCIAILQVHDCVIRLSTAPADCRSRWNDLINTPQGRTFLSCSVVSEVVRLPAENAVGVEGIEDDHRQHECSADEDDCEALRRGGGLPDGHALGHDIGVEGIGQARKAEREDAGQHQEG